MAATSEFGSAIPSLSSPETPVFRESSGPSRDKPGTIASSLSMNRGERTAQHASAAAGAAQPLDGSHHQQHSSDAGKAESLAEFSSNSPPQPDVDSRSDVSEGSGSSVGVESSASTILHNNLTAAKQQPHREGREEEERANAALSRRNPAQLLPGELAEAGAGPGLDDSVAAPPPRAPAKSTPESLEGGAAAAAPRGGPETEDRDSEASSSAMMDVPLDLGAFSSSALLPNRPTRPNSLLIPKLTSESIESHLLLQQQAKSDSFSVDLLGVVAQGGGPGAGAAGSEVLSTASEMGTVIEGGGGDRMAQVEDVLLHHQQQQHQRPAVTPKSRNNFYERMFDNDDDDKDEVDREGGAAGTANRLALPRLDGAFHVDEKKVSEAVSSTVAHAGDSNDATLKPGVGSGNNASSILSRTMKRFSSNLLSASAPNTPRSSNHRPLSRKVFAASDKIEDPPALEPLKSPWSSVPSSAETPTSFLLRSPGSSARMAAKRQHRHRHSLEEAGTIDLMLPRFSSWTRRRDDIDDATPTGARTPPPHGVSSSLVNPTPQQQPPSSSGRKYSHVLARACFSFDAYDTCVDHLYEVPAVLLDPVLDRPSNEYDGGAPWASSPIAASTTRTGHARYPTIPERSWESSTSTPISTFANSVPSLSPLRSDANRTQPLFRTSASWDVGPTTTHSPLRETRGTTASTTRPLPGPFAFRPTRSSPSHSFGPQDRALRQSAVHRHQHHFPSYPHAHPATLARREDAASAGFITSPPRIAATSTPSRPSSLRNGFASSPHRGTPRATSTPSRGQLEVLASPQRLEMEREDALDILACLVERGVTLKNDAEADTATVPTSSPDPTGITADSATLREAVPSSNKSRHSSTADRPKTLDMALVVESLVKISSQHRSSACEDDEEGNDLTQVPPSGITHEERVRALEELLRSHEYALEMKRVSQSASSWLQSIGRKIGDATNDAHRAASASQHDVVDEGFGAANVESRVDEVDLLTAKAMLHSACVEIEERSQHAEVLNVELAKCRAEIGRLKSAANNSISASFRSPNRSILDVSEELSPTSSVDRSFDNASPIPGKDDSHCLDSSFEDIVPLRQDKTDLAKFQAALEDANEMIRKLHGDLKLQAQGKLQGGIIEEDAPVVMVSDVAVAVSPSTSKEEQAYSLEAENYVTEWDEIRPSLPPPPDHDLRSPIVDTVLEQWSSDPTLRERLLEWMEQVLSGADPISIPPLTLSHLDNQVRDGFTTHVLPLLLRRPDIRVDVQTRAQRLTTYDLAVSVERVVLSPPQLSHRNSVDVRRHSLGRDSSQSEAGTDLATHSTVTALVSNKHRHHPYHEPYPLASTTSNRSAASSFFPDDPSQPGGGATSRLSHDEMADGSVGPHHSQPGIMSALGGALGGLLSRRKGGAVGPDLHPPSSGTNSHVRRENPDAYIATPRNNAVDGAAATVPLAQESAPVVYLDDLDDDEPYHRVVAAPPGRLGVTFVEYRGHAMVSDVAEDKSPLKGWIFPGDILIAIDELSVSGMRLRDVIQVLKDRGNRQRALRVISSHDMNELTLSHNTSAVMNDVS